MLLPPVRELKVFLKPASRFSICINGAICLNGIKCLKLKRWAGYNLWPDSQQSAKILPDPDNLQVQQEIVGLLQNF